MTRPPSPPERLLTAHEAAALLGVSVKTLGRMHVPAVELRTSATTRRPIVRYERAAIEQLIAASRTHTPEVAA